MNTFCLLLHRERTGNSGAETLGRHLQSPSCRPGPEVYTVEGEQNHLLRVHANNTVMNEHITVSGCVGGWGWGEGGGCWSM